MNVNYKCMPIDTFGKKLTRWREAAGINQAELARRVGVSPTYISNLERDSSPSAKSRRPQPRLRTIDKIAKALGVSVDEVRLAAGYAARYGDSDADGHSDEVKLKYLLEFFAAQIDLLTRIVGKKRATQFLIDQLTALGGGEDRESRQKQA